MNKESRKAGTGSEFGYLVGMSQALLVASGFLKQGGKEAEERREKIGFKAHERSCFRLPSFSSHLPPIFLLPSP
jgi:hypothetical protein